MEDKVPCFCSVCSLPSEKCTCRFTKSKSGKSADFECEVVNVEEL